MKKVFAVSILCCVSYCKKPAGQNGTLDAAALKQSPWIGIDKFGSTVLTFEDSRVKYEINMETQVCGSAAYTIKDNTLQIGTTENCKGTESHVAGYSENPQTCTLVSDNNALDFKTLLKCTSFSAGRRDSQVASGSTVKLGDRELISMGWSNASIKEAAVFRSEPDAKAKEIMVERQGVMTGPGQSEVLKATVLPAGETIQLIARTKETHKVQSWDNYWYYVAYYGTQVYRGWVYGEFVNQNY